MTTTPDAPPFAAFAALRRGDTAPDWISTSVRTAWNLPPSSSLTLIAVSENASFRIDVDGVPTAVLRVHRPGYVADPAQIAAELTWVRAIAADTSVRVPDVLALADGSLVHEVVDGTGVRWFAVAFAFVRGEILAGDGLDDATLRRTYAEIGATTAALHDHVATWETPAGFSRFGWGLDDALGATSRWGDWRNAVLSPEQVAVCERAETAARDVLAGVPETPAATGLVHADLRPSNIMVDPAGRLTVIDFDDCGTSRLLWDFAAALSFIEHERFAPAIATAWLAGYRSVRTVSEEDLAVATALSTVRRLQMLGWTTTHREDALPPAVWAAQVPGTAEVAQRYLNRPNWLLENGSTR